MSRYIYYKLTHNNSIVQIRFHIKQKQDFTQAVTLIKGLIAATSRSFDPNTKMWEIDAALWEGLKAAYTGLHFRLVEEKDISQKVDVPKEYAENFYHEQSIQSQTESAESIAKQLSVFLDCEITTQDISDLKRIYRKKALELHPDRPNGNATQMSELNRLWTIFNSQDRSVN